MTAALHTQIEAMLAAVSAKQVERVLTYFADDAHVIDPHYPIPHMIGKAAIADGMRWAFAALDQMQFSILTFCVAADEQTAALEVATVHTLRGGTHLRFTQTFVVEARDGRITRLQAYTPYGPPGLGGVFLKLVRLRNRIARRRQPT